jgi:hypothetical protein
MILNAKRFCLMVFRHKNSSWSEYFSGVSLKIRCAEGFAREKMIYIALIVQTFFERFGTKPFLKKWFRINLTEPFSHQFFFLCFGDTLSYTNRTIIVDDEECPWLLFTWSMKTEWILFYFINFLIYSNYLVALVLESDWNNSPLHRKYLAVDNNLVKQLYRYISSTIYVYYF